MLIESPELGLRLTQEDDIEFICTVESAPENQPFVKQWAAEQHLAASRTPGTAHFVIVTPDGERVGYAIILDIESPDASIQLRRIVIRDKGRGYGRATVRLIKRFSFERVRAHRLWLEVRDHNTRAKRLYESEGFITEGLVRDSIRMGDRYESVYLMSIIRHEYESERVAAPSSKGEGTLYLRHDDVETICREIDAVALIREVFRLHGTRQTILPDEAYLSWTNDRNELARTLNMPAYVGGSFKRAGTKIINSNVENPAYGRPRASGLTLLFDTETARIQCVMEGAFISALRTASVSMLAISMVAYGSVRTLTIIGTGSIGAAHAKLAPVTFPSLERLVFFDLNPQAAASLRDSLQQVIPSRVSIELAPDIEAAVRMGDSVIAATTVTEGYIPLEWLEPDTTAVNVSLDDLKEEVLLKSDLLFVDDWPLVRNDSRRLLGRLFRKGLIAGPEDAAPDGGRRVDGTIADLVLGRHPGRQQSGQIVVVNPFGLAIEDVAFASRVFDIATERGTGIYLPL